MCVILYIEELNFLIMYVFHIPCDLVPCHTNDIMFPTDNIICNINWDLLNCNIDNLMIHRLHICHTYYVWPFWSLYVTYPVTLIVAYWWHYVTYLLTFYSGTLWTSWPTGTFYGPFAYSMLHSLWPDFMCHTDLCDIL